VFVILLIIIFNINACSDSCFYCGETHAQVAANTVDLIAKTCIMWGIPFRYFRDTVNKQIDGSAVPLLLTGGQGRPENPHRYTFP
jgi:hypothetical protein